MAAAGLRFIPFRFCFSCCCLFLRFSCFSSLALFMSRKYIENMFKGKSARCRGRKGMFSLNICRNSRISHQGVPHRNNIYFPRCEPHVEVCGSVECMCLYVCLFLWVVGKVDECFWDTHKSCAYAIMQE